MTALAATTRVAAVLGSPVRHSLSPVLHNAAFAALGLDWAYVAFEVREAEAEPALRGAAALGLAGLSITMPLKDVAARVCDELSPRAATLGAVNCVVISSGRLIGHSTDGDGFLDALPVPVRGERVVVLGAGGAARAVVAAVAGAGAAEVVVVNRTADRGERAAALAGGAGRLGTRDDVPDAQIVVNATSVGMGGAGGGAGTGALPCPAPLLHRGQTVVDLVYHPVETAWLAAARGRGATAVDGVGMLVHQAAHALGLWTGLDPPLGVMEAAARARLATG